MPAVTTPERDTITRPSEETDVSLDQPWNVIIHDDPVNLMSYVSLVIKKLFGYPNAECERLMRQVHYEGRSIVWTGARERAEHYVHQLHRHQLLSTLQKAN